MKTPEPAAKKKPNLTAGEQLLHSTVLIQCQNRAGTIQTGTGFIFHFFSSGGRSIPAVVTNKHVVRGATIGQFVFTRAKEGEPELGNNEVVRISDFEKGWIPHPDPDTDLTVFLIGGIVNNYASQGRSIFFIGLDQSLIPTKEQSDLLKPIENLLVIGYPDGIFDAKNNIPIVRRGTTATPPYIDFQGKKEFLIDAAIFPGSSGSPVFLFDEGAWTDRSGHVIGGTRVLLLGVVYAVTLHTIDGELKFIPAPTQSHVIAQSQIPNNIGLCIKAAQVLDFEPLLVKRGIVPPDGYKVRAASP